MWNRQGFVPKSNPVANSIRDGARFLLNTGWSSAPLTRTRAVGKDIRSVLMPYSQHERNAFLI
eukprot:jgi/Botrbrau1/23053/Bobra.0614s0002.1